MDRLFVIAGLCALLALAPLCTQRAQPVFFSLFFPQLTSPLHGGGAQATPGEAVFI